MKDILILQQIADTIVLCASCVKNGYRKICYFNDADNINTVNTNDVKVVLRNLEPGQYFAYAENNDLEETGHISFSVSNLSKDTLFKNIAISQGIEVPEKILHSLSPENYIQELYQRFLDKEITEEAFIAFVAFYNANQEDLNAKAVPEFTVKGQIVSSRNGIAYRFIPYYYDPDTKSWNLVKDCVVHEAEEFSLQEIPERFYKILVLKNSSVVREFFLYQTSEAMSDTILEEKIEANKNKKEILTEQITQINLETIEEDEAGQNAVVGLLHFRPDYITFRRPEITIEDNTLVCHIPDYPCFTLLENPIYLAVLEFDEVFANRQVPHRYEILAQDFIVKTSHLLVNTDTEYVYYLTDKDNRILSDLTLLSLNAEYPAVLYMSAYARTLYDRYVRKLNAVFKEYNKAQWNKIALLLEQYLFYNDAMIPFHEFMWQQLMRQDPNREPIDRLIELVTLCALRYDTDLDQSFIRKQVYSQEFKSHVFPESDHSYIVRAIRFNNGKLTYDYYLAGKESLSIRMDHDEYLLLQCIDPETWKMSAPAFYNNRIRSGAPYFYFPNLEVTVL